MDQIGVGQSVQFEQVLDQIHRKDIIAPFRDGNGKGGEKVIRGIDVHASIHDGDDQDRMGIRGLERGVILFRNLCRASRKQCEGEDHGKDRNG